MLKIHPVVREIILGEIEAYNALVSGYMNMSGYASRIKPIVEEKTKKETTINSIVVSLLRLKKEFKKEKPLIQDVTITNISSKLPLSEITYENNSASIKKLASLYAKIPFCPEDFFTSTVSMTDLNIICSMSMANKVTKHFKIKPKIMIDNLAAIVVYMDEKQYNIPNTLLSLILIIGRANINIVEIISTNTEIIFIISENDFAQAVSLFATSNKPNKN